jgi:hypothetical protein
MSTNIKLRVYYACECCHYSTYNKTDYERHIITPKHIKNVEYCEQSSYKPDPNKCSYCNKLFKHRTSVYKHMNTCKPVSTEPSTAIPNMSDLPTTFTPTNIFSTTSSTTAPIPPTSSEQYLGEIAKNFTNAMMMLFQQNAELHSKMMELCKNTGMSNSHNTNCVNSNNNQQFSMNFFLNEKCKDAMNMKDFVDSIQVNMTDVENVERLGYVQGMSNILMNTLQKTDVYKRPVHCSDAKRETLYVKDNDKWERDGPDHPKMTNAVLAVEHKNVVLVNEWAKANPRCMNSHTRENDKYMKLSKAVTDGDKEGNIAKVIRKVAKEVTVEKD